MPAYFSSMFKSTIKLPLLKSKHFSLNLFNINLSDDLRQIIAMSSINNTRKPPNAYKINAILAFVKLKWPKPERNGNLGTGWFLGPQDLCSQTSNQTT